MQAINTLHITKYPTGRFGYVGQVPVSIGYVDATPEQIEKLKFGGRFGPKVRTFATHKDAVDYAQKHGYTPQED
jgi:hypothetical protein